MCYKEEEIKKTQIWKEDADIQEGDFDTVCIIRNNIVHFLDLIEVNQIEETELFQIISEINDFLKPSLLDDDLIMLFSKSFLTNVINVMQMSQIIDHQNALLHMVAFLIERHIKEMNDIFTSLPTIETIYSLYSKGLIDFNCISVLFASLSYSSLLARNQSLKFLNILQLMQVYEDKNEEETQNATMLLLSYCSHQVSYDMAFDVFALIRVAITNSSMNTIDILSILNKISQNQMKTFKLLQMEMLDDIIFENLNSEDALCCQLACNILTNTLKNDNFSIEEVQILISHFSENSPLCFMKCLVEIFTKLYQNEEIIDQLIDIGSLDIICLCSSIGSFSMKNDVIICLASLLRSLNNNDLLTRLLQDDVLAAFEPGLESDDLEVQVQTLFSMNRLYNFALSSSESDYALFLSQVQNLGFMRRIEEIETNDIVLSQQIEEFLEHFPEEEEM